MIFFCNTYSLDPLCVLGHITRGSCWCLSSSFLSSYSPDDAIHLRLLLYHLLPDLFLLLCSFPGWSSVHSDSEDGRHVTCCSVTLFSWIDLVIYYSYMRKDCNTFYMCQHPHSLLCVFNRKLLGCFSYISVVFFPGLIASFAAIITEKKGRRGTLALYTANLVSDTNPCISKCYYQYVFGCTLRAESPSIFLEKLVRGRRLCSRPALSLIHWSSKNMDESVQILITDIIFTLLCFSSETL